MKDLVYVDGDDWNALYEDGILKHEGHDEIANVYLFILHGIFGSGFRWVYADYDWLLSVGRYPKNLSEVEIISG